MKKEKETEAEEDGEQRGRKCVPSVYIRGTTFASSLTATSCSKMERCGEGRGRRRRQIGGGLET